MITPQSELPGLPMHDLHCICTVTLLLQCDTIVSDFRFAPLFDASSASKKFENSVLRLQKLAKFVQQLSD